MATQNNKTTETTPITPVLDVNKAENPILDITPEFDTEGFLAKYGKIIGYAFVALIIVGGIYIAYGYMQEGSDKEAQEAMFPAVYRLEKDDAKTALKGDGNNVKDGLEKIAKNYGGKAGNLANFYLGVAYMKESKFKEAISALQNFTTQDLLVQARALCLIGDAYMELNNYNEAVRYYLKSTDYKANKQFTPVYLMKLALAQEKANKLADALESYNRILEKYPQSTETVNAKKHRARVEALLGK